VEAETAQVRCPGCGGGEQVADPADHVAAASDRFGGLLRGGVRPPPSQLGRAVRVVGEQEVLDRVLDAAAAALAVAGEQRVDAALVRLLELGLRRHDVEGTGLD